ncbi:TerC family protein [Owenweeksia hongkongensis]|uniref:Membrane protein TerC, possibly involved in tellurium resistance n=1 Tax=Owenweeksia hongkongensis (strain DSM 17368 / CIP 108786 / JCM 12287 / NRRL B-23963 / UST20020801) TaxID=926562 RepID=G8R3B2_OWEHD|nr:TerC family protein [Owenweeksia hongkongensis]AEV31933.1 membrane protein TerC, possibly involved in tellurium resistance [Owenweeksia hongkongensis DSM 17368]
MDFEIFLQSEAWIALLTLSLLEVVLGIDNIIFISLLTNKLPEERRKTARTAGIGLALILRVIMLLGITWIIGFTQPIFEIFGFVATGRDLVLLVGGLFLIGKSTSEIHHKIDGGGKEEDAKSMKKQAQKSFVSIIIQIGLLDIVFSFDSILTAIGMTEELLIMILAVVISLIVMLIFAGRIAAFIERYPTLQILALAFLILIGFVLIADGLHQHISKGYIYFAVAFSLATEVVNINMRKKSKPSTNIDT